MKAIFVSTQYCNLLCFENFRDQAEMLKKVCALKLTLHPLGASQIQVEESLFWHMFLSLSLTTCPCCLCSSE